MNAPKHCCCNSVENADCGVMGWSEGSREREDWMSAVEGNIGPVVGEDWIKTGAARCEKCGLEKRIEDAEKVGWRVVAALEVD